VAGVKISVTFLITHDHAKKPTHRNLAISLTESEALVLWSTKIKLSLCMPKACRVVEALHHSFLTFIGYRDGVDFVHKMYIDIKLCKSHTW